MKKPKRLDFTPEEVENLITRIENQNLEANDFILLADVLRAMIWMEGALKEKSFSIARLKAIFGIKTEKAAKLVGLLNNPKGSSQSPANENQSSSNEENNKDSSPEK